MVYTVKELQYTLQGEGAQAGRPVVLLRFTGCNLWNGRERDRATATCTFCDTDFVGTDGQDGGRYATARDLAQAVSRRWGGERDGRYVVLTGGEPLLQADEDLVTALHGRGFEVGVETNGTQVCELSLDWICVSPKAGAPLNQRCGDELKVVWPQPLDLTELSHLDFTHFWLQPMDGLHRSEHEKLAVRRCLDQHPWRLSVQAHKMVGIP
jgi:7-carboxy-7-deazaguanine synthase (Cx14CxxC type)